MVATRPLRTIVGRTARAFCSSGSDGKGDYTFEPFESDKKCRSTKLVAPLLPKSRSEAPHLLETEVGGGMKLMIGASARLSKNRPGNGGFRIWKYPTQKAAAAEAIGLAQGMEVKHLTYNTGYSGAKVVCNVGDNDVEKIDKKRLLDDLNDVLVSLNGKMYTGCDLNSTLDDMAYLSSRSPYILAAIGNDRVDPNHATAHGVVGAIMAMLRPDIAADCSGTHAVFNSDCEIGKDIGGVMKGRRMLVHGCGAVGSVVAQELAAMGAEVLTMDAVKARADVRGCTNITGTPLEKQWWTLQLDALVPCSKSGLITSEMAKELRCTNIVGASNLPFESAEAQNITEGPVPGVRQAGIKFLPEGVTSAGAVIVDSIEQFDQKGFTEANPNELYAFCRQHVFEKATEVLAVNAGRVADGLKSFLEDIHKKYDEEETPTSIGASFSSWKDSTLNLPSTALESSLAQSSVTMSAMSNAQAAQSVNYTRAFSTNHSPKKSAPPRAAPASPNAAKRGLSTAGEQADVVIAGGGIMGLNIAYNLKARDPKLKVVVLEKAAALGNGSSGWSTGFLRAFYSFDETMQLALDGIGAYKNWNDYTGLKEVKAYFTETGALWMLGKQRSDNEVMQKRLKEYGVDSTCLDAKALKEKFPAMSTEAYPELDADGEPTGKEYPPLEALFEHGCGHMDSSSCLEDILEACLRDGVEVRFNTTVSSLLQAGGKATGVALGDGSSISAGVVVNCMGPWFAQLNKSAGIETSTVMLPTRIQVGHINIEAEEHLSLPFTADAHGASGIYFMPRRANKQLVFGSVDHRFESEIVEDPDQLNTMLDNDVQADYLGCLLHRLPTLPARGKVIGFSHMYTVNQDDVHPVIGESSLQGFFLCNGFSGHGFKLAPAVGSLVTQQIFGSESKPTGRLAQFQTGVPLEFMSAKRQPLSLKVKTHFA